jgi:hypothetical protein
MTRNGCVVFQVGGLKGLVQTSGFIPPGKKEGQLEIYNVETDPISGK